jgi:hypothetical protein
MRYKIFEIDTKRKDVMDGYDWATEATHRIKELRGEPYLMSTEFESLENALLEIKTFAEQLKSKTLTILPIIQIDYEGQL